MTLATALDLAATRGWHVLPLLPGSKRPYGNCGPCTGHKGHTCPACARGNCQARWCHAHLSATSDPTVIERNWPNEALLAVATEASGLAILDVETGGMDYARDLIRRGLLPRTLCQRSTSGTGMHLIYSGTVPTRIKPILEGQRQQLDIKSAGAYIRWTGNIITHHPVTAWPPTFASLLTPPTPSLPRPLQPAEIPVHGGCRHTPTYATRGLQMAVAYIAQYQEHGAGSATYGRARAIGLAHLACPGPCGLEDMAAALVAAAVSVGVPEPYATRQVARGLSAAVLPHRLPKAISPR